MAIRAATDEVVEVADRSIKNFPLLWGAAAAFMLAPAGPRIPTSGVPQVQCPLVLPTIAPPPSAPCGWQCGTERWPVKTLNDRDREQVDFTPRRASVTELGKLTVPRIRRTDRRSGAAERRVYCVEAWIVDVPRPQNDGDLHIVLAGIEDSTTRMIAEIPDVRCASVCESRYAAAFATARQAMERRLATWQNEGPQSRRSKTRARNSDRLRVLITGVGFFDRNHGQIGAARNFFELHPVLTVQFP